MKVVDGSRGGGQLVRAAASVSGLTGTPVRVVEARANRESPGLKAQHIAAITAAAEICRADTDGIELGATSFEFVPDEPRGGEYRVDVGTAGSISLVFDTVLPFAATIDERIDLTVTGGTDVAWAPTIDYYRHVKLPFLAAVGLDASTTVHRRGFYPAGGGKATLALEPSDLSSIAVTDRGGLERVDVYSTSSSSLEDAAVADRQADAALEELAVPASIPVATTVSYPETRSPGSVLDVVAEYEHTRAGVSALGKRGKPAETVATEAVATYTQFETAGGAVDEHLADQLIPFLAVAGGRVRAPILTNHVETHCELFQQFGFDVGIDDSDGVLLVGSSN